MQTKSIFSTLSLVRRFQRWMARPLEESQINAHNADVPDYLRSDVGLAPHHRMPTQRSGDPPTRDSFRLL